MYKILTKSYLTDNIIRMEVEAKRTADRCLPGQFVIVRGSEDGERIPLTICDYDREKGTIVLVFQTIGASTTLMADLKEGDSFTDIVGPLGCPSELCEMSVDDLKKEKIIFIAGGVGTAPVYPQLKWLKEQGVPADVIIGARNKDLVILEEDFKSVAENVYITTDDGSYGRSGNVCVCLQSLIDEGKTYTKCIAIGPLIMMKFAVQLTKQLNIPTIVSMNPIMVDGTGMCGACRVHVGDEIKFACIDGPEFDGWLVNFDESMRRQAMYKTEEGRKLLELQEGATHHGGCGNC